MTPDLSYYLEGAREKCEDNTWDEAKKKNHPRGTFVTAAPRPHNEYVPHNAMHLAKVTTWPVQYYSSTNSSRTEPCEYSTSNTEGCTCL